MRLNQITKGFDRFKSVASIMLEFVHHLLAAAVVVAVVDRKRLGLASHYRSCFHRLRLDLSSSVHCERPLESSDY